MNHYLTRFSTHATPRPTFWDRHSDFIIDIAFGALMLILCSAYILASIITLSKIQP